MMLVATFGTSTAYAYWSFSVLGHVMDALYGDHLRIHCQYLTELREKWQFREKKSVLITTDRPEVGLSKLLTTSGFPCLAFVDQPDDAIAEAMGVHSMPLHDAIRFSTGYFCCLGEAFPVENVRFFGKSYYVSTVREFTQDIITAIVGVVDESIVAQVLERIAPELASPSELTVRELMTRQTGVTFSPAHARDLLPTTDQGLIKAVAEAYKPIFEKREAALIEWPREMFYTANKGYGRPGDIELIGPARFLLWGPYLSLPVGGWRAAIEFEVIDNLSGNEIEADVSIARQVVASAAGPLPALGMFRFFIDFMVADPNSPIEVRIQMLKGAIEGKFGLRKVVFERTWSPDRTARKLAPLEHQATQTVIAAH